MIVHGNGSIVPREDRPRSRCRSWMLQVVVEADGERKRKSRAFHGTYTQAQAALAEFVSHLRGTVLGSGVPFADWCDEWQRRRRESGAYSERTLATDAEKLAPAVKALGDRPISDLRPDDFRSLYQSVQRGETPSGREWSPRSVIRMHTALCKCMSDAVEEGILPSSPMRGVRPPRPPQQTGSALTERQMDGLLGKLDMSDAPQRGVALALCCGLRRSECCGLRWGDIRGGSVHVVRSCSDDGSDVAPKTDAGYRTVPMPSVLSAMLEGVRGDDWDRVVGMLPKSLSRWWMRNRGSLGCPGVRFHDLRHSYATRLAANGVHVRVAMQLCGWSSMEIALKVYTHVPDSLAVSGVEAAFRATSVQLGDGHERSRPDESAV